MNRKGRFDVFDILKKFDIFGKPIPSFNFNGKNVIKTTFGAIVSIVVYSTTYAFAAIKY